LTLVTPQTHQETAVIRQTALLIPVFTAITASCSSAPDPLEDPLSPDASLPDAQELNLPITVQVHDENAERLAIFFHNADGVLLGEAPLQADGSAIIDDAPGRAILTLARGIGDNTALTSLVDIEPGDHVVFGAPPLERTPLPVSATMPGSAPTGTNSRVISVGCDTRGFGNSQSLSFTTHIECFDSPIATAMAVARDEDRRPLGYLTQSAPTSGALEFNFVFDFWETRFVTLPISATHSANFDQLVIRARAYAGAHQVMSDSATRTMEDGASSTAELRLPLSGYDGYRLDVYQSSGSSEATLLGGKLPIATHPTAPSLNIDLSTHLMRSFEVTDSSETSLQTDLSETPTCADTGAADWARWSLRASTASGSVHSWTIRTRGDATSVQRPELDGSWWPAADFSSLGDPSVSFVARSDLAFDDIRNVAALNGRVALPFASDAAECEVSWAP
jgi:hypothetical protein